MDDVEEDGGTSIKYWGPKPLEVREMEAMAREMISSELYEWAIVTLKGLLLMENMVGDMRKRM